MGARLWIREHAVSEGAPYHWQLDDNLRFFARFWRGDRIYCEPALALGVCEDLTLRYRNVGLSGLNYVMFVSGMERKPPFVRNCHVYSCSLVNHAMPYLWRLAYNDDTDLCLQLLSSGWWCTVLLNVFLCGKMPTMKQSGGNTEILYAGDGRARMSRELERMWPGVVRTIRRFSRPQHLVNWKIFTHPLLPADPLPEPRDYSVALKQHRDSPSMQHVVDDYERHGESR